MGNIASWLPPAMVGVLFTVMGGLKLYGMGGRDKPTFQYLCGT